MNLSEIVSVVTGCIKVPASHKSIDLITRLNLYQLGSMKKFVKEEIRNTRV